MASRRVKTHLARVSGLVWHRRGSSRQIHGRSIYRLYQSLLRWNNSRISAVLVRTVSLISAPSPCLPWERVIGSGRYLPRGILTARYNRFAEMAFVSIVITRPRSIQISLNYSAILTLGIWVRTCDRTLDVLPFLIQQYRFLDISLNCTYSGSNSW